MNTDDIIIYAVLLGSVFVFGGAAVLALSWAMRDGQFENLERGARSIFDPAEPIGESTDHFPDAAEPAKGAAIPQASKNGSAAKDN
jgi:cbb3-type cytochrome oxidase maturation protein